MRGARIPDAGPFRLVCQKGNRLPYQTFLNATTLQSPSRT